MAVEVIDQIARADIDDHEVDPSAHGGTFITVSGDSIMPKLRLMSPNGTVWEFTVSNEGVLSAVDITGDL